MEQDHTQSNDIKKRGFRWKIIRIIGLVLAGVVLAGLFALVLGIVVQWLWNWLMPNIFGLNPISYWQAFGLLFLAKLLFGGLGHHHPSYHPKKWVDQNRTDHWKHYNRFWRDKGNAATEDLIERIQTERSAESEGDR
jgi:hypothetical protein